LIACSVGPGPVVVNVRVDHVRRVSEGRELRGQGIVSMAAIKDALEQHAGMVIKVLVVDYKILKKMVDAIPSN
jgi:hypothetical protein